MGVPGASHSPNSKINSTVHFFSRLLASTPNQAPDRKHPYDRGPSYLPSLRLMSGLQETGGKDGDR
ncbi:hypothetical protein E2C01_093684 [Portunus trituberculatus]|uniref:Uncharacterized protein n=1 Tax=Portunus trituberculatus TaxID=210409 RepID=A0A5B7JZE0_PORTR|nr:hypothetical protein [Portunus trituberculatus]